jgi:hypothetical protein
MRGNGKVTARRGRSAQLPEDVRGYLTTLRRIPAPVRQSMAAREFDMNWSETCVCGWAIRDALEAATGRDSQGYGTPGDCVRLFGGTDDEWYRIYYGVLPHNGKLRSIETAFAIAVAETVRP